MVYICVSTTYDRLMTLSPFINIDNNEHVSYIVSCQGNRVIPTDEYRKKTLEIFGNNVLISFIDGFGLSINRNNAIFQALKIADNKDYIYICDDDVEINFRGLKKLTSLMEDKNLEFAVGKVETFDGEEFKCYKNDSFNISSLSCGKISSIEIIVSVEFLSENSIRFNEMFGLGARYPSGEEFIFCNDLLKAGGRGFFFPIVVCKHPPVSSGTDFFTTKARVQAKGAMLSAVYGTPCGFFLALLFSLKKFPKYMNSISFFAFTKEILKAALNYKI